MSSATRRPPGRRDAQHLLERARQVDQIAQHEGARDGVEAGVGERQLQAVGADPAGRLVAELLARAEQHLPGEVGADDSGGARALELVGEVARTRAEIEHIAPARRGRVDGKPPPATVETGGHDSIHAVVLGHEPAEHRLDRARALVVRRHQACVRSLRNRLVS